MRDPIVIDISDSSAVGEIRRAAAIIAERVHLDSDAGSRAALVVTEMATNVIKHATRGLFLVGVDDHRGDTLEVLALDAGPGIGDVSQALSDGHSTTGTPGTGLGAARRHANFFQLFSRKQHGTAILARFASGDTTLTAASIGAVSIPVRGETINGDGWATIANDEKRVLMVVDGLGHGPQAAEAAAAACSSFRSVRDRPAATLKILHDALRGTRGAAVAVAELDADGGVMRYSGIGNISATIIDASARRSAVSLHGIVGHQMREAREFTYRWSQKSTLIMHSDGLATRWDLDAYPGLLGRDAVLVAAVLWKDHRRPNDDSTVVVVHDPS